MINRLFIPGKKEDIKTICKNGFNLFILPVENMSIGFNVYYSLDEINELSKKHEIYLVINRFFHHDLIDEVINTLGNIKNIRGMFIEDLGLLMALKDKQNVINYQNHLNMNYEAINMYSSLGINNIVLSNELTINEIKEINDKTNVTKYYFMVAKNILMYTRRNLITNYNKHFGYPLDEKKIHISETVSKHKMLVLETDYGTAILNDKIFSGNKRINELKDNIDYFIYSFTEIEEIDTILNHIDDEELNSLIDADDYFLNNEIFYKVKDVA